MLTKGQQGGDLRRFQLGVFRFVPRRLRSFPQEVHEAAVPLSVLSQSFPMILCCDLREMKSWRSLEVREDEENDDDDTHTFSMIPLNVCLSLLSMNRSAIILQHS